MTGDGNFLWYAGEGEEPDYYAIEGESRDAVIAQARTQFGSTAAFTIVEADKRVPSLPDGEHLFESFLDSNMDLGGEDHFGESVNPTREQFEELTKGVESLLREWLTRHDLWPFVFTFGEQRNYEFFPASGQEGGDA